MIDGMYTTQLREKSCKWYVTPHVLAKAETLAPVVGPVVHSAYKDLG